MDEIIVMENGEIVESGSYDELMDHQGTLANLMRKYHKDTADTSSESSLEEEYLK